MGYESEARKVMLPRLVEGLSDHRVTDVACGLSHTLGKQLTVSNQADLLVHIKLKHDFNCWFFVGYIGVQTKCEVRF